MLDAFSIDMLLRGISPFDMLNKTGFLIFFSFIGLLYFKARKQKGFFYFFWFCATKKIKKQEIKLGFICVLGEFSYAEKDGFYVVFSFQGCKSSLGFFLQKPGPFSSHENDGLYSLFKKTLARLSVKHT